MKYIYINLERHNHRKVHMEMMLEKLQLPYSRFNAICPTLEECNEIPNLNKRVKVYLQNEFSQSRGIGVVGCYLSHLSVLNIIKDYPESYICILEDDLEIDDITLIHADKVINYLNLNYDWDMFRVIRNKFDNNETKEFPKQTINEIPIYKIETPHYQSIYNNGKNNSINGGTYFQIINRKNIPRIIDYLQKEDVYNIDAIYSTNQLNVFYGFNKDFQIEINLFDSSIPKEYETEKK